MHVAARALRIGAAAFVISGGLIVASCGGGSVATTPVASATSAPVTQSVPSGGGTLTLASSTAQVATVAFSSGAPAGTTITATSGTTAPANAPAVTSLKRKTESVVGGVPFFYVTFSVSSNLSAQFISSESVTTSASQPASATYGVEFADITTSPATALGDAGPATSVGGLVTIINAASTNPPTLLAGHTYVLMFFYVPAGTVQPSATPSAGATSTPTPVPSPTATATSGTQAAFPCGSAPPSASTTISAFATGSPIAFPSLGSCQSSITFQSGTTFATNTSITVTTSLAEPSGAPTPLPLSPTGMSTPKAALLYETLAVNSGSITVPSGTTTSPQQSITLANTGTCSTYGESFTSAGQAWQGTGSGTLSGLTATFGAGQNSSTVQLTPLGSPYYVGYFCY